MADVFFRVVAVLTFLLLAATVFLLPVVLGRGGEELRRNSALVSFLLLVAVLGTFVLKPGEVGVVEVVETCRGFYQPR